MDRPKTKDPAETTEYVAQQSKIDRALLLLFVRKSTGGPHERMQIHVLDSNVVIVDEIVGTVQQIQ